MPHPAGIPTGARARATPWHRSGLRPDPGRAHGRMAGIRTERTGLRGRSIMAAGSRDKVRGMSGHGNMPAREGWGIMAGRRARDMSHEAQVTGHDARDTDLGHEARWEA